MCGRYTLAKSKEEIEELVGDVVADFPVVPRYNIAPSQPILALLNTNLTRLTFIQWGMVPHWAKDPSIGNRMINARSETVAEKPAFRMPFRRKRCLILADGFYEWQKKPGQKAKQPMYITLRSGKVFAFAGLWEEWHGADGSELTTSTILTTEPNSLLRPIHQRMPVILPPTAHETWLCEEDPDALKAALVPYPPEQMQAFSVSTRVNNVRYDHPDCIEPTSPSRPGQTELDFQDCSD